MADMGPPCSVHRQSLAYTEALRAFTAHLPAGSDVVLGVCEPGKKHPVGGNKKRQFPSYKPEQGHGLCLITGKGPHVTVVDLDALKPRDDATKRVSGVEWFLANNTGWPNTWRAETPGGGVHLYFSYTPLFNTSKEKCFGTDARGLLALADTRSDLGHIMLPPTKRPSDGKVYKWICEPGSVPLASVPQWLQDAYADAQTKKRKRTTDEIHLDRQVKNFRVAPPEGAVDQGMEAELLLLCELHNPQKRLFDREAWLNNGMAIAHATGYSDVGRRIWDRISEKCPEKYDDAYLRKTYASFKPRGPGEPAYTIRSLYWWAKEDNPHQFNLLYPPAFLDVHHAVYHEQEISAMKLQNPTTCSSVWQQLRTLLLDTVGYDGRTDRVYVKEWDPFSKTVVYPSFKRDVFRQKYMSQFVTWREKDESSADDAGDGEGDADGAHCDDGTGDDDADDAPADCRKKMTLTKVFDHTVFGSDLRYGAITQKPWNRKIFASYPVEGAISTFPGFAVSREADRRNALGLPIEVDYIEKMQRVFRVWAGGTGEDVEFAAPTATDPGRRLPGDSEEIKRHASDIEKYWAYRWQRPDVPPGVILIIYGYGNTNKSLMVSAITTRVFGQRHIVKKEGLDQADEKFTGHLSGVLFFHYEEAGDWMTPKIESKMKAVVDSPTVTERIMQNDPTDVQHSIGYILTTNTMDKIVGDKASGCRKYKVYEASYLYSQFHPSKFCGKDPGNIDQDFNRKRTDQLKKTFLEDPEWAINVGRHLGHVQLDDWEPSRMEDTPATKEFKRKSAPPVVAFLLWLGEECEEDVFMSFNSVGGEEKSTRQFRTCSYLYDLFTMWCKRNQTKPRSESDFKGALTSHLKSVGVEVPYSKVKVTNANGSETQTMIFAQFTRHIVRAVIQKNLDATYDWPTCGE